MTGMADGTEGAENAEPCIGDRDVLYAMSLGSDVLGCSNFSNEILTDSKEFSLQISAISGRFFPDLLWPCTGTVNQTFGRQ